jgi:predicted Fe-Mo cluster-binding NifX family protein
MKIAIASLGDNLDAWVGSRHNWCSKFLVVDPETMEFSIHVVPEMPDEQAQHRAVIRTIAESGAEAAILGVLDERCQRVLANLSIEAIIGVRNLTVREAAERYRLGELAESRWRTGEPGRLAVATAGDDLEAPIPADFRHCARFLVVDPVSLSFRLLEVAPSPGDGGLNLEAVRVLAQARVTAVLTGTLQPGCRRALAALAIEAHEGLQGLTARLAVERYRQGLL